jgi:hypothetical protein
MVTVKMVGVVDVAVFYLPSLLDALDLSYASHYRSFYRDR